MQSKTMRAGVVAALTAVIVGLLPALPAFAALNGTASITSTRDLFAGRQSDVTFRFNNPSTATIGVVGETQPTMNRVQIVPAPGFAISCPGAAPTGWTCLTTSKGVVRYSNADGGIAPGTSQSFDVTANAGRPANDQTRTWQVQMSPDDGDSFVDPDASTPGALDTTVRILQVISVVIFEPPGAVDNTVTSGQNNTSVDVTVINAGSAAKETTATLTSPSGSDSVRGTPPGPEPIPAYDGVSDGSHTFRFGFNFGNTGTRKLTGDASATGANAVEAQSADITIQTPKNITYIVGSLQPLASRSGESHTFTLGFNVTGQPSARDLAGTLTFRRNDGSKTFTADLTSPSTYPEGSSSEAHTFGPITIPGTVEGALTGNPLDPNNYDGDYDLSVNVTGTDGNDADINLTKSINDIFTIDNLIPGVVPTLATPNRQGQVGETRAAANATPTREYVVKNGQQFTIGGNIFKAGESGQTDNTATVIKCELRVFNDAGVQTGNFPLTRTQCRESGLGTLTGTFSIADLGVPSGTARLYVEVQDKVPGNVGSGISAPVIVDNVIPRFATGSTGCRGLTAAECAGGETRTVQVPTTEVVTGSFLAAEFTCQSNAVTNATFNGDPSKYGNRVILTLATEMDEDAQPDCSYLRPDVLADPLDSPENPFIVEQALDIIDDIAPDLPTIEFVNGRPAYSDDGMFYTNDSTPEVTLAGLRAGYTGIVARETNGTDGYQFGSDAELCRFGSAGEEGSCSTADLGADSPRDAVTGEHEGYVLYGASLDARGNVSFDKDGVQTGNGTPFDVVLDRVAPQAATAVVDMTARTISVDFDEKLDRGRNSAQDWTIRVLTVDGEARTIKPGTVANGAEFDKKIVTVNANAPGWNGSTVRGIEYSVEDDSTPSRRFEDRAGNALIDFPPGTQPTIV